MEMTLEYVNFILLLIISVDTSIADQGKGLLTPKTKI